MTRLKFRVDAFQLFFILPKLVTLCGDVTAMTRLLIFIASLIPCAMIAAHAEESRPNMIVIVCDDLGFSDLGCFGGEIETPNLDRLASGGLRMIDFHNNAKCSETRASIMTGLWHHQSNNLKSKSGHVTIAEVLRSAGYSTLMSGKWHLAGTPRQRGFDRFFGFLSGAINFWTGKDWGSGENLMRLDDEEFHAPSGFYSTDAFTDYAIEFLEEARGKQQPYFLYLAHNAPHFPLHAPKAEIEKYKGRYDVGWDVIRKRRHAALQMLGVIDSSWRLSERDPKVEPWDSLEEKERAFLIPMMEVYAAMVDRMDQNIGRLIENLKANEELDNTLIVFFSDNGACPYHRLRCDTNIPPGGPDSDYAYDARWANMCNSPLRLYKQYAHEGGTATPMIVHWPKGIQQKKTVSPYESRDSISGYTAHLVDLMPTAVELAGAEYPNRINGSPVLPMEGESLVPFLRGQRDQRTKPIFWEFASNHSVRDGDWKLVAVRGQPWELYNLSEDRSETNDLCDKRPDVVNRMAKQYDQWAKRTGAKTHAKCLKAKPSSQSQLFELSKVISGS